MDAVLNAEDAEAARKARKKTTFRVLRSIYLIYLLGVLSGWEMTYPVGTSAQIGWWLTALKWLAVPTLPAYFLGTGLWVMGSQSLADWMNGHPHASIAFLWGMVSALGYIQWFIFVPWIWKRLRMKVGPRTSSMAE